MAINEDGLDIEFDRIENDEAGRDQYVNSDNGLTIKGGVAQMRFEREVVATWKYVPREPIWIQLITVGGRFNLGRGHRMSVLLWLS